MSSSSFRWLVQPGKLIHAIVPIDIISMSVAMVISLRMGKRVKTGVIVKSRAKPRCARKALRSREGQCENNG
uniref:Transmembrane protein n=1 Tax=Angiostrongylus cantonensis TaxID=6313 RepID=A0A0K0DFH6_ANGCA